MNATEKKVFDAVVKFWYEQVRRLDDDAFVRVADELSCVLEDEADAKRRELSDDE